MDRFAKLFLGLGAAVALTTSAFAGTTLINTNGEIGGGAGVSSDGAANELPDMLNTYYGGTGYSGNINTSWTITGVAGGNLTLVRIQDTGGSGSLALDGSTAATANDQTWSEGTGTVNLSVAAVEAQDLQNFGYRVGTNNTTLFTNQTSGGASAADLQLSPGDFDWFDRVGDGKNNTLATFYSNPTNNTNSNGASAYTDQDHMVTFEVLQNGHAYDPANAGAVATWLICFEDTNLATADADYNDLVVQVTATATLVPLPTAAWMGMLTLAGMGMVTAVRRHHNRMA